MKGHLITFLALVSAATSAPIDPSCPPAQEPTCRDLLVPIQASANNTLLPAYPDSTTPTAVFQYLKSLGTAAIRPLSNPVTGTFNISMRYCEPTTKVESRQNTIQLLVHGLGYTKSYWNGLDYTHPDFATEYSWLAHAASQGYATLAIDSLGNGLSSRPDPLNIVQLPLQVAVFQKIIASLRIDAIPNVPKYKTVIMGSYSFGSITARTLATSHPTDGADAYILNAAARNLTGFGASQGALIAFQPQAASVVDPKRFKNLVPGYLSISKSGIKEALYSFNGDYSPAMLSWDQNSPHVFAIGEIVSGMFAPTSPSSFTGPVSVLTGRYDQIACGQGEFSTDIQNCGVGKGSNPDLMRELFPKASKFDSYSPDRTGHSLNTHYSAPETFGAAHQWLESVGF